MTILLSALILVQSSNIGMDDILQFDELIEHAQFHKQEYGDNFFVFMSKHYGELKAEHSKNHQDEQPDHDQLPFQCQGPISTIIAFLPNDSHGYTNEVHILDTSEFNFHYFNFYSLLYEEELLQPPKQA